MQRQQRAQQQQGTHTLRELISVGTSASSVVPIPNCPFWFRPQLHDRKAGSKNDKSKSRSPCSAA